MIANKILISILILFLLPQNVLAKKLNEKKSTKLIVEADKSLEWFEKEKYYVAKGNVILKKDGLILKADFVKASYKIEKGENVLKKIIAQDKVIVLKQETKATGQFMTYDVSKKIVVMSGSFQNLTSTSGYIESKKTLIFNELKNKAEAEGNVKVILSNKTVIFADNIRADLNSNNKSIETAIAKGNVIIKNKIKGNTSKANLGIYNSLDETIKLSGDVIINNNNSTVSGSKGETNLKTGVSFIISDPKKKERVKGVFSPRKKSNKGEKTD